MEKSKQLEVHGYKLEDLRVERNPEYRAGTSQLAPAVDVEFGAFLHQTDLSRFAVSLSIKSEPAGPEHPLKFSARIVGFFSVAEPMEDRKVHPERAVNALTILYGMVRMHIDTCASWFGESLVLPTVYFTDLVNERAAATREQQIAEGGQKLIETETATTT